MFGLRKRKPAPDMGPELKQMFQEAETLLERVKTGVQAVDRTRELAQGRARRDAFVSNMNASVKSGLGPELDLTPHCIFPPEVWTNPIYDEFLFQKMPTTPYDPWNTLLLASDDMTSLLLGIPVVPTESASEDILAAHMHIGDAQRSMAGSALAPREFLNEATKPLYVYAMRMAAKKFGAAVVIKTRENFSQDPSVKSVLSAT